MSKATLPSGQTVKWKDDGTHSVYANIIGFSMSSFDISLLFGEIQEATTAEVAANLKTKVIISPEQVSNLIKLLGIALQAYIESNGDLRHGGAVSVEEVSAKLSEATQLNRAKTTLKQ
jgi:hypothetical protein